MTAPRVPGNAADMQTLVDLSRVGAYRPVIDSRLFRLLRRAKNRDADISHVRHKLVGAGRLE